ncbi:MAG: hypothetical protein QOJ35_2710 [Solirubrobacteraceae bacterium]|jgi:hypothetical protein|nr:hypothetical protein [Solirubrobacteraceae bacterium]
MKRDLMRYDLQLEMLERDATLGDERAIELLRSEFALARNAAHFDALTGDDVELGEVTRSTPQEGVTRFAVELLLSERGGVVDDERALALLRQAFTNALNASYFVRVCTDDDVTVRLVSRAPARDVAPLRSAA